MLHNRVLNESVVVKDLTTFGKTWSNFEKLGEGVDTLGNAAWADLVAKIAFGGITDVVQDMVDRLLPYEAVASEQHGVPRKRAARKGVAATDYVVPPTFKSYKSTIKGALENGVELLDANGMPRSRNDVSEELKDAKKVERTDEEKLGIVTETWLALFAKANDADPNTVDAVNKIINALSARGLMPVAMADAA